MKRQTTLMMSLLLVLALFFGCVGITAAQDPEYIPVHTEEELTTLFGQVKDYLDENGEIKERKGKEHDFSYRHSAYSDSRNIILDVTFELSEKNKNEIFFLMQDTMEKRKKKQPLNRPSAGSVFKRPEGYYAAALIEQCGLKGVSIGGAQVSEKHSGFIVNNGGATAKDVKELIDHIKSVVKSKTGVDLHCEIKYVG